MNTMFFHVVACMSKSADTQVCGNMLGCGESVARGVDFSLEATAFSTLWVHSVVRWRGGSSFMLVLPDVFDENDIN